MLSYNELKKGTVFIMDGEPWKVLDYNFLRMQQRKPIAEVKIKNLINGKVISKTVHQNENFEEAELQKKELVFLYSRRDEFWFSEKDNPKTRFALNKEVVNEAAKFLKQNLAVTAVLFKEKIINIELPVKMDFIVREAPPAVKGNTAQGGTKMVTLENGLQISVPLFINEEDIIRVNTETGEYVERVSKT